MICYKEEEAFCHNINYSSFDYNELRFEWKGSMKIDYIHFGVNYFDMKQKMDRVCNLHYEVSGNFVLLKNYFDLPWYRVFDFSIPLNHNH